MTSRKALLAKKLKQLNDPVGTCMYIGSDGARCKNRTIGSHSIQKGGSLKSIATKSHVYALRNNLMQDDPNFKFRPLPISKASIFPGYCKKHDNEFFLEIENGEFEISPRNLALVTARAFARDIFTKSGQLRMNGSAEIKDLYYKKIGRETYDEMMAGTVMAKQELDQLYKRLVEMVHSDDFSQFTYICFEASELFPFSFSGTFTPEHTIQGRNILPEHLDPWNVAACFCGNIDGKNILLVSSILGQDDATLTEYFESYEGLKGTIGDYSLNFGLEYTENIFFNQSWVNEQSEMLKLRICAKMHSGLQTNPSRSIEGLFEFTNLIEDHEIIKHTTFLT